MNHLLDDPMPLAGLPLVTVPCSVQCLLPAGRHRYIIVGNEGLRKQDDYKSCTARFPFGGRQNNSKRAASYSSCLRSCAQDTIANTVPEDGETI